MNGRVQIYTGNGKGKTTAAIGLAIRAAGAGLRTFIGQFLKGRSSGELRILRGRIPEVTVCQFGTGRFIMGKASARDIKAARAGLASLRKRMLSGKYDIVIADELNNAVAMGLCDPASVVSLVESRPRHVELVITGRSAHPSLIRLADLVTEMRNVKHYMDRGVTARRGIEK